MFHKRFDYMDLFVDRFANQFGFGSAPKMTT